MKLYAATAVLVLLLALTPIHAATIRIGLCGALHGPASAYGSAMVDGARLAIEEINRDEERRGGNDLFRLETADDGQVETLTSERFTALIYDRKVVAVIGTTDSGCTHVAARIALKAKVPLIATVATDPTITRMANPYVFRNLADDRIQGRTLVDYIVRKRGHKRLVVAHVDTRYGRGGAAVVERAAAAAGAVVDAVLAFETGRRDFSELARRISSISPDAVVIWGLYAEGAALVKALQATSPSLPVFGPDGLASQAFLDQAGAAAEGVVLTYPFDPEDRSDPTAARFIDGFRAKYGRAPDSFAAHAYDAVYLVREAIRRGGSANPRIIRKNLAETRNFHGATGLFAFDSQGNCTLPVKLARVREGRFTRLKTSSAP